ncbi:MAG TPA: NAD(P)-dependent oxidoreductase [Balneolaceae bacterium]|nr:NAD(P)-dependent oxidoreductase [Balneolaceae bacterium]
MNIGFYGLGIMGSRMAANLLKTDADVMVYNRTISKANPLKKKGAKVAQSQQELAQHSDILFTMLSAPGAVKQTASGKEGFIASMKPDSLWVDCSTVNPSFSREMAGKADTHNIRFLDAPAAGTKGPAETGDLLFLVGGSAEDIEECNPYFKAMGKKVIHAGDIGMGTSLKMVFNLLLAEAMASFSEGLYLGESMGFSKEMLLETLVGSPVVAPFISGKKEKIENDDYSPEFPLKLMQKDLHLASQTGYESDAPLPAGNIVKELFAMAKQEGLGDKDFSAIYKLISKDK